MSEPSETWDWWWPMSAGETCPFCGHGGHRNERCAGTSDDGAYPCACSFPDPENFTFVEEVTLDGEPVTPDDGDMLARSAYRRFLACGGA